MIVKWIMHTNFFRWTWTLGVRYSRTVLSWTELDSQQTLDICLDRKVSSSFECCGGVCPLLELPVTKKFRQGEHRTGSTEWVPDLGSATPPMLLPLFPGFLPSKDFSWSRQKGQDISLWATVSSKGLSKFYQQWNHFSKENWLEPYI